METLFCRIIGLCWDVWLAWLTKSMLQALQYRDVTLKLCLKTQFLIVILNRLLVYNFEKQIIIMTAKGKSFICNASQKNRLMCRNSPATLLLMLLLKIWCFLGGIRCFDAPHKLSFLLYIDDRCSASQSRAAISMGWHRHSSQ